jgi:hypothetical protein
MLPVMVDAGTVEMPAFVRMVKSPAPRRSTGRGGAGPSVLRAALVVRVQGVGCRV